MKIAIDISAVVYGTGVSVYTKNLVENLIKIDRVNEYILFGASLRRRTELYTFLSTFKEKSLQGKVFSIPPTLADFIWNRVHILPIERLIGKVNVFHSSDWTQPPSNAFRVTTVHDLVPIKFSTLTSPKIVSTHHARLKWVKKEIDRVIVPSMTTAKDVERMGINKDRIRIIPEAPSPQFKPSKKIEVEKLKSKYRISGKYLLAVGVNSRKNTQRIIDAFEKTKTETGFKLVVIGHQYIKIDQKRGIIFTGHIPQADLPRFYSGAEALIYPSLYEGFGIPILESFVCNTPVVTSNFGSMAEVAGKAAVLVDPYDVNSITEGILEAISNKEKLIRLGSERVKLFSWQKTAEETLKVYRESR